MPVRNSLGQLLTTEQEQDMRWTSHFEDVLNRPDPEHPPDIPPAAQDIDINLKLPEKQEIVKAIGSLRNNKAPGNDEMTAELFKIDPILAANILEPLFADIWEKEELPKDWTRGTVVKIPKKGDLTDCNNWRGITLLSIPSKIFCKIVIMRIQEAVDKCLRMEQAGFRKGRGTNEHIFTLRNILEQCSEWQRTIYINFIDFEKAFDSVHRDSLWKILRQYGVPQKLVNIIVLFYKDFSCNLKNSNKTFPVKSGVRQGCVMSSLLFSITIDWVLKNAIKQQAPRGIRWTPFEMLEDLDFADDIALVSHKYEHIQEKSTILHSTVGLKTNTGKTKIMTNSEIQQPVMLENETLERVEQFTYLGSVLTLNGGTEEDIKSRLSKARTAFARMKPVWKSKIYNRTTKLKLYKSIVLPVLLYGSECWRMTKGDTSRLSVFHHSCLRRILGIFWPVKISNNQLLQDTRQEAMNDILKKRRWKWLGHVMRMRQEMPARIALTWTPEGKRKKGRPRTTWRRMMEEELDTASLTWGSALKVARDRRAWKVLSEAPCVTRHDGIK